MNQPDFSREIVLTGRPNSGKSSLFNRLSTGQQRVANFAGCTVEKKTAPLAHGDSGDIFVTDLPGIYSMRANSMDEEVAIRHLNEQKGVIHVLVVVNGNNLLQEVVLPILLRDYGFSVTVAVNMIDEVNINKRMLDLVGMNGVVGLPFFPVSARTGEGIEALRKHLIQMTKEKRSTLASGDTATQESNDTARMAHAKVEARKLAEFEVRKEKESRLFLRDQKLDRILMNAVLGPIVFLVVMFFLFQSVFTWAEPLIGLIESTIGLSQDFVKSLGFLPEWIASGVSDGLIAGVGAVVVFVPQIAILFFFIGLLDYSGYLPRVAMMVDRLLRPFGLEGKSFIPLLSSVACAVPGVMATRSIENERSRLLTILISPLMTCSARLPVYTLLIGAFVPGRAIGPFDLRGIVMFSMFLLAVVAALGVALLLKKSTLIGHKNKIDFLVIPHYRTPQWRELFRFVIQRVLLFLKKAGTVIAGMAILLWILLSFPKNQTTTTEFAEKLQQVGQDSSLSEERRTELVALHESALNSRRLEESFGGRLGHFMEPLFRPLGYDWKLTIGILASLAAREVFVATLGTIFALGEVDENSESLSQGLREAKNPDGSAKYTLATCVSLLCFFAFSLQCISTIGVVKRETNSWKVPAIMFVYMFALAYGTAFVAKVLVESVI